MKTPAPTRRERLEAREAAILAAAHSEFAEAGFEGTRMSAIAQRASVAEGTVYLYYRNKAELLQAVVSQFWHDLTAGARSAVAAHSGTLEQFESLASYHLEQVIADFDFIGLTAQVRQRELHADGTLAPIRAYVRVFDDIFDRGVARGEFRSGAECRHWRDLFYGQLEYSARTLIVRGDHDPTPALDHLTAVLQAALFQSEVSSVNDDPQHGTLDARLSAIDTKLTKLLDRP